VGWGDSFAEEQFVNPVRLIVLALAVSAAGVPLAAQPANDTYRRPLPDGAAARVGIAPYGRCFFSTWD
jgi:hypothetical protein